MVVWEVLDWVMTLTPAFFFLKIVHFIILIFFYLQPSCLRIFDVFHGISY